MKSPSAGIVRVAIIDDDPYEAAVTREQVTDGGYEALVFEADSKEALLQKIRKGADAAVCDHRLSPRGFAQFSGAELVADLFNLGVPAVLVTQFTEMDAGDSIRRWRRYVPVLLERDAVEPDDIVRGFERCLAELRGESLPDRRPRRALLRVEDVMEDASGTVVDAVVPQWNPRKAIRFPATLLPPELRTSLTKGARFLAMVNTGAERSEDLFFYDFEMAPDPNPEDGLA